MYLKIPFTEDYVQKDFMIGQKASSSPPLLVMKRNYSRNPINMDTEGAVQTARINQVFVLSGMNLGKM